MVECNLCHNDINDEELEVADKLDGGEIVVCFGCSLYLHSHYCCEFEHNRNRKYYRQKKII
jgi:hypothetical protein